MKMAYNILRNRYLWSLTLILGIPFSLFAQHPRYGIQGQKAPEWQVKEWINLPKEKQKLELEDFQGKVVYLYCFQSWCPGCHSHGFPTLKAIHKEFEEHPEVAFVAIQTVFEGFQTNTLTQAKQVAKKFELDIPIGHDPGLDRRRSEVLKHYRTGGTPWTILIDSNGVVRYNHFRLEPEQGIQMIRSLLEEKKNNESIPDLERENLKGT